MTVSDLIRRLREEILKRPEVAEMEVRVSQELSQWPADAHEVSINQKTYPVVLEIGW